MINNTNGLHLDFYQLNMAYVYFKHGMKNTIANFEVFFRQNPFNQGHCVFAGNVRIQEVISNFTFSESDIQYLKKLDIYDKNFLEYLANFKFTGTIYAPQEGEIIFANEPIMVIEAPIIEAQLIETMLLNIFNYHVLITTKASKIRQVTSKPLYEFGSRRGYELDASLWGARNSIIAGFDATSLVEAGKLFNAPIIGTHSHSFIQSFENEKEAFEAYSAYHKNLFFLIDTYDVINSGLKNVIALAKDKKISGIRIDSGDLATLSKQCRAILDANNLHDIKILVSNDLDEHIIVELQKQQAPIDAYGIGTKLISCADTYSLGAVYKLTALEQNQKIKNVIKISNTKAKTTVPGKKRVYRLLNENKAVGDVVVHKDEQLEEPIQLFNELFLTNNKLVKYDDYYELLQPIIKNGEIVEINHDILALRNEHKKNIDLFEEKYLRYAKPEIYPVGLSKQLYDLKLKMIEERS